MKVTGVDHVSVTVSDLTRSLAFYQGLLGISLLGTGSEGPGPDAESEPDAVPLAFDYADLDLGGGRILELLHFTSPTGLPASARHFDPGVEHFGLAVDNLAAALEELAAAGVRPLYPPLSLDAPEWWKGARAAYLLDPDGAVVELVERTDHARALRRARTPAKRRIRAAPHSARGPAHEQRFK